MVEQPMATDPPAALQPAGASLSASPSSPLSCPPPGSAAARWRISATPLLVGLWFGVVLLAEGVGAWLHKDVPTCMFKVITGKPCPTCGTTRASLALLRGDLASAFLLNPLFISLLALAIPLAVIAAVRPGFRSRLGRVTAGRGFALALLVLMLINWVWVLYRGN